MTPTHGADHSSPADPELMARVSARDEAALASVYDRYMDTIYGSVVRFLGDRQLAEEVAQDTFLAAWRGAGGFDPAAGSLPGWLLRIARTRAIDRLRSAARRPSTLGMAGLDEDRGWPEGGSSRTPGALRASADTPASPDPEEAATREWSRAVVRTALSAMPPDERRALELAYDEQLSQVEIAARLGWPLGTVKSRTRRALATLRTALEGVPGLGDADDDVILLTTRRAVPDAGGMDAAR